MRRILSLNPNIHVCQKLGDMGHRHFRIGATRGPPASRHFLNLTASLTITCPRCLNGRDCCHATFMKKRAKTLLLVLGGTVAALCAFVLIAALRTRRDANAQLREFTLLASS